MHLVALGTNPAGAMLHAYGAGTSYNAFFREIAERTFDPSPSITVMGTGSPNNWRLAGRSASYVETGQVTAGTYAEITATRTGPGLVSPPDLAYLAVGSATYTHLAAFDTNNTLSVHRYVVSASPAEWVTPAQLPAPTGTLYEYSPTICTGEYQGTYLVYLAAVAGGRLYTQHLANPFDLTTFGGWILASTESVASAPDCVITNSDKLMHIVALNAAGAVLHFRGDAKTATQWAAPENLGTF